MASPAWYHGTGMVLDPGDLILPGCDPRMNLSRPGRVYFTSDLLWALGYAVIDPDPHVYQVVPLALRTYRDVTSFCGVIDHDARWSCQPLVVAGEVSIPADIRHRMTDLVRSRLGEEVSCG